MQKHRISARAAIVRSDRILLIEYNPPGDLHYNLPGGGVEAGESLQQALRRELMEEARAEIEVGRLLLVWEYYPPEHDEFYGPQPALALLFECRLAEGSEPAMPTRPDPNQSGVRWIPLDRLNAVNLYPQFHDLILQVLANPASGPLFTTRR